MQKLTLPLRLFSIFLSFYLLALPTMQASAALRSCRTDPIFKMSNGDSLAVTVDIAADATNVRNVTYLLHVPAGVTVTKVTFTAGGLGTKEMYKVYQDSPAKTYTTDTVVTVQNTGAVTAAATTRLNATYAVTVSGLTGQHLLATVSRP